MTFKLTILGSNSAIPAHGRFPTAQVLNIQEELFLIDCGEGTQIRLSEYNIKRSKIHNIFISHLHGDHVFGLIGLVNTFGLMGRKEPLHIFAPPGLEAMIQMQLDMVDSKLPFILHFHPLGFKAQEVIYKNKQVQVYAFPVRHRIPTWGFLFRERPFLRNMDPEAIRKFDIPFSKIDSIKRGADFIASTGEVVPNREMTFEPPLPRSYAFCADTLFHPPLAKIVEGVDLLYHEATFLDELATMAKKTMHSTAKQAAQIAQSAKVGQLIIGHFSTRNKNLQPFLDEARAVFLNTQLALDGSTFNVPLRAQQ